FLPCPLTPSHTVKSVNVFLRRFPRRIRIIAHVGIHKVKKVLERQQIELLHAEPDPPRQRNDVDVRAVAPTAGTTSWPPVPRSFLHEKRFSGLPPLQQSEDQDQKC